MIYTDLIDRENIKKEVHNYLHNLNTIYYVIIYILGDM